MELLSPAGSLEALYVAVHQGADSVYLGGKLWSARAHAANFSEEELKEGIAFAHLRDVKVYLALNTLLSSVELDSVLEYLFRVYNLGIDAVIVQDLSLIPLIRKALPGLDIHASTQMTLLNQRSLAVVEELGVSRVVLPRELSLSQIRALCASTTMQLEVFAHGALCFCYSGQCLMSSFIGGRSGNQGQCAQTCRLPFHRGKDSGYLLSFRDLNLSAYLGELESAGVSCVKLEGRMKKPSYVEVVTEVYRKALDKKPFEPDRLKSVFNRGFTSGYLLGTPGKEAICQDSPKNEGEEIGWVVNYQAPVLVIKVVKDIAVQDGLQIQGEERELGFVARQGAKAGDTLTLQSKTPVKKGVAVYRTRRAKQGKPLRKRVPVHLFVSLKENKPLQLTLLDASNLSVTLQGEEQAVKAHAHPLTEEILKTQLLAFGETPFYVEHLEIELDEGVRIPLGELKAKRRELVLRFEEEKLLQRGKSLSREFFLKEKREQLRREKIALQQEDPVLAVSVSSFSAMKKAVAAGAGRIYFFRGYGEEEQKVQEAAFLFAKETQVSFFVAFDRIVYDGELEKIAEILDQGQFHGVLAGNLGVIEQARGKHRIHTDTSLNCFNDKTVEVLRDLGVSLVTLSLELHEKEIRDLLSCSVLPLGLVVQGSIEVMVSAYCFFGKSPDCCLKECKEMSYLLDRQGYRFPVVTDRSCRTHILNPMELCLAREVARLKGLSEWRIDGRYLTDQEISERVLWYQEVKNGAFENLAERLGQSKNWTKGHYNRGVK